MHAHGSPKVHLVKATAVHSGQLESLLDDYLGELSAHREVPVGAEDAASYRYLDAYWREAGRHAFFIVHEGGQAGFAFVRDPASTGTPVHQLAEFYVKPGCRRRGFGRAAARAIWDRFPGKWELQVHGGNDAAVRFWQVCAASVSTVPVQVTPVQAADGGRYQLSFRVSPGDRH